LKNTSSHKRARFSAGICSPNANKTSPDDEKSLPIVTSRKFRGAVGVAASAVLAFVAACFAHEVAGHAAACLIGGGTVVQVSSSIFACRPGTLLADLGGPCANFVLGLASLILLRGRRRGTALHLVLALSVAFNMFWVSGELLMSALVARDDFAYAARIFCVAQIPVRGIFGALGIALVVRTCRLMGKQDLPRSALRLAYCVAGAAVCASAIFAAGPIGPALREAALESFGAMAWLWCVRPGPRDSDGGLEQVGTPALWPVSLLALIAFGLLLALGHGYAAPAGHL
jgi:hypothetical protein